MLHRQLKEIIKQAGIPSALEQLGLRGPIHQALQWLSSPAERERSRIIREDLSSCQKPLQGIARGAPSGNPNKVVWMVSSFPTVWGLKLEGVMSLALRLQGFCPVVVELHHNRWVRRYHRLFGNSRFLRFLKYQSIQPKPSPSRETSEFFLHAPDVSGLLNLRFHGVDVGRVVLSNILNRRKFEKFDITDPGTLAEVRAELLEVQRNVLAAEKMVARHRPAMAFMLEKGVSPMAEVFGVCVAQGVPVVQYVNSQNLKDYVFKRYSLENRTQHPFSLDESSWKQVKAMPWSPSHEEGLMEDFAEAYQTGTWFNRKFLHQGKEIKPAEAVRRQLGLDPDKKTAVIFSHVLWDATFFYGKSLFDDYETWLLETVRAACANRKVNWVIKLHPDLVWKLKYENHDGELQDIQAIRNAVGNLPEHVKLVPPETDIDTYSFFGITDYCLTVRGTIGIEMACRGVPVLTAGTGRYSGLGFTLDSASMEEFLDRLAHIESIPPLSPHQIELARRFAYALFKLRPWPLRSFETVKMGLEQTGHPLETDLVPAVKSFAQFSTAPDIQAIAEWVGSDEVDLFSPLGRNVTYHPPTELSLSWVTS